MVEREAAARLLAAFVANVRQYRATWGIPVDKEAVLNAWRDAKRSVK